VQDAIANTKNASPINRLHGLNLLNLIIFLSYEDLLISSNNLLVSSLALDFWLTKHYQAAALSGQTLAVLVEG
jgi:hypothetical protein